MRLTKVGLCASPPESKVPSGGTTPLDVFPRRVECLVEPWFLIVRGFPSQVQQLDLGLGFGDILNSVRATRKPPGPAVLTF